MSECCVWWARPAHARARLEQLLDARERERAAALARPGDRARMVVGAALLRLAAAERLGCAPDDVVVDRDCPRCGRPHGRPRLPGSGLEASVSHGGDRVVVALCAGARVGVDVECARRHLQVDDLARTALDAEEAARVAVLDGPERKRAFLVLWTRKEAVLKALGCGLTLSPRSLRVSPPHADAAIERWPGALGSPLPLTLRDLAPGEDHVAALAVVADGAEIEELSAAPLLSATGA